MGCGPILSRIMFLLWDYRGAFGMIVRDKKIDLRLRFDALKEKTKPSACALGSHFEQALYRLGVLPLNRLR